VRQWGSVKKNLSRNRHLDIRRSDGVVSAYAQAAEPSNFRGAPSSRISRTVSGTSFHYYSCVPCACRRPSAAAQSRELVPAAPLE
jgi:hypothetical protein